jgi:hypothetical protein
MFVAALLMGANPVPAAGAATTQTAPTRYVRGVCVALYNWEYKVSGDDTSLLSDLNASKRSPKSTRQAIAELYERQTKSTDKLIATTKAIGAPRLSDGQQLAADYLQTLGDERAAYSAAHNAVLHTPIANNTAFAAAMTPIDTSLAGAYWSIGDPLLALNADPILAAAILANPVCSSVTSTYKKPTTSSLQAGDCTAAVETKVDCSQPHSEEVTLVTSYPADSNAPYPGNDALNAFVDQTCDAAFSTYVGVTTDQSRYESSSFSPNSAADWNDGDREIVCLVDNPDNSPLTGSLKGAAS